MCLVNYLAFVVGAYLLLISLSILVNKHHFKKIMTEFLSNHALVAFSGAMGIIFGLLLVTAHNVWVADWPVLITIVGWFILLQGIARSFFPEKFHKWMKQFQAKQGFLLSVWVCLIVGIYLLWAGFTNM